MGDEAIHPGDVLAGRYRVERVLGRGAVALVLSVMDLQEGVPRAVKLLGRSARSLPSTVERFFREARAMARLHSEHAVRIFDVGTFADGAPYMVMEHLDGADLGALLKRRGALPAHEAALYLLQACEAVGEAHDHGIVHRDLKPRNLFLTHGEGGRPSLKVLDFGFSKQLTTTERERLTLSNAVLGSPAYMSPEQIISPSDVGARSDVWSLGVVLYQLVTGQLPFKGADAAAMMSQVMRGAPVAPSTVRRGLPLALDGVVLRCLEKDPAQRFPSVAALSAALAPFVPEARRGEVPAPASEDPPPPLPPRRRIPLALALGLAVALAAVLGVTLAMLHG
jgi:eukaryotic-like serine/threonine-protein kinase